MIIIWVILADLVIIASFALALKSMSDYKERPANFKEAYGLFLIQNPGGLKVELLTRLHNLLIKKRFIISLERLYKGDKRALVIYGPNSVLSAISSELGLLELEDYTANSSAADLSITHLASSQVQAATALELAENEQLWYQLVIQPAGRNIIEQVYLAFQRAFSVPYQLLQRKFKTPPSDNSSKKERFYSALTVAALSADPKRRDDLIKSLSSSLPSSSSTASKLSSYKDRALPLGLGLHGVISAEKVVEIIS